MLATLETHKSLQCAGVWPLSTELCSMLFSTLKAKRQLDLVIIQQALPLLQPPAKGHAELYLNPVLLCYQFSHSSHVGVESEQTTVWCLAACHLKPLKDVGTSREGCPGSRPCSFWRSPRRRFHSLSAWPLPFQPEEEAVTKLFFPPAQGKSFPTCSFPEPSWAEAEPEQSKALGPARQRSQDHGSAAGHCGSCLESS